MAGLFFVLVPIGAAGLYQILTKKSIESSTDPTPQELRLTEGSLRATLSKKLEVSALPVAGTPDLDDELLKRYANFHIEDMETFKFVKVLFLDSTMSIKEAMQTLSGYKILAAPVVHRRMFHHGIEVIGVFDAMSALQFIIQTFEKDPDSSSLEDTVYKSTLNDMKKKGCMPGKWMFLYKTSSLLDLMQAFTSGIHRVPILDETCEEMVGIMTQSSVLRLLMRDETLLGTLGGKTMEEAKAFRKREFVVSVKPTQPVVDAFRLLLKFNLSAVAVVDDNGVLVGSVSNEHARGLSVESISCLTSTVEKYLESHRYHPELQPVTVPKSETVYNTVLKVCEACAHRAWVVDADNKLEGLMTLTDLMRLLLPRPLH